MQLIVKNTDAFFDRKKVQSKLEKGVAKALLWGGGKVRQKARTLLGKPVKARKTKRRKAKAVVASGDIGKKKKRKKARRRSSSRPKASKPRPPGKPPRVRTTSETQTLRNILFQSKGDSVIIGPVKIRSSSRKPVPELHEKGGSTKIRVVKVKTGFKGKKTEWRSSKKGKMMKIRFKKRPFMKPAFNFMIKKMPKKFKGILR